MIVLATMHNDRYQWLASTTCDNNKVPYCLKHDYELAVKTNDWGDVIYYDKIQFLIDILENNPAVTWVWWLDCDAMITDFTKKIEDIIDDQYHIIISTDCNGINCGSFFVKNSPQTLEWLYMIMSTKETYKIKKWDNPEQHPMIMTYIRYRDWIKLLPQRSINSYFYQMYPEIKDTTDQLHTSGQWQPGDWVLHLPAVNDQLRLSVFQQVQQLIKY